MHVSAYMYVYVHISVCVCLFVCSSVCLHVVVLYDTRFTLLTNVHVNMQDSSKSRCPPASTPGILVPPQQEQKVSIGYSHDTRYKHCDHRPCADILYMHVTTMSRHTCNMFTSEHVFACVCVCVCVCVCLSVYLQGGVLHDTRFTLLTNVHVCRISLDLGICLLLLLEYQFHCSKNKR